MKIKYSENVIGCRIGDIIYLHPDLNSLPSLRKAILKHELKHSNGFNFKDLKIDFSDNDLDDVRKDFYKFLFNHPKVWIGYLPISRFEGKWTIDIAMVGFWLFAIVIIGGVIKFLL